MGQCLIVLYPAIWLHEYISSHCAVYNETEEYGKKSTRNEVYFSGEFRTDEPCTVNCAGHYGVKWGVEVSNKDITDSFSTTDKMKPDYQNIRSRN